MQALVPQVTIMVIFPERNNNFTLFTKRVLSFEITKQVAHQWGNCHTNPPSNYPSEGVHPIV